VWGLIRFPFPDWSGFLTPLRRFNRPGRCRIRIFKKLVAVIRMAVPYTGMILSTRETAELRRDVLELGISQISAGSRTNPGGYQEDSTENFRAAQFNLGDTRTLDEVILDITQHKHIPSSAQPATGSAGPAPISWIWPNRG